MSSEGIKLGNRAVEQFVKGDVVNLKSKSPVMTVIGNAAGDVVVAWFVPPGQVQTAKFPPEGLEKYVAPEPKPNNLYSTGCYFHGECEVFLKCENPGAAKVHTAMYKARLTGEPEKAERADLSPLPPEPKAKEEAKL